MSADLRVVGGEAQDDRLVGTTIDGRYEVEAILGEGGMGLVYKARHIVLNKPLALKVLRPDVSRDEEIITRFRQEAQSASAIGNQHIIDISDFGVLPDGSTYFVMEYLGGTDLTGAIESSAPLEPVRVVHIAKQLCQALGAAHEAGIVHRDLKPDNIYLVKRGGDPNFVKVLDFGIAKVGGASSKLTRAGQVFGTPHYMSPEQCAGSGVDHRTDIYALGIILYEMTTGEVPFDADNLMGVLTKHLYEEPTRPRERNPSIPADLELVILKAIAKQADSRYQTMAELLEDLKRVEAGVGTMAREDTQGFVTGQPGSVSVPTDDYVPGAGGRRWPIVLAAVLLLGLGGAGVAFVMSDSDADAEVPPVAAPQTSEPAEATETPAEVASPSASGSEEAADEAPAPEPVMVRIVSEPPGSEVWRGEEVIGLTPVEVPRPEGDDRLRLELRADGYRTRSFVISSLTQPEITFRLERVHRRRGGMRAVTMATVMAEESMQTVSTQRSSMMAIRPSSEVLDPWAN